MSDSTTTTTISASFSITAPQVKRSFSFRQCRLSVMDNIADPGISFDEKGICNYYYEYKVAENAGTLSGKNATTEIERIVAMLKTKGKNKKYDCIIGISGGIDSTYLSLKAKEYGLRVLCVHLDNGWDSELAVKNIENVVSKCGFDLYTYVIDWEEFRDIQRAYFKAGVMDIEAVTDIAIFDSLDSICGEKNVGYILDGRNIWTEQTLPYNWVNKNPNNLYSIHQRFGKIQLNKYPAKFKNAKHLRPKGNYTSIPLLNYLDYNKKETKEIISSKLGWQDYGGKHYESVFTRFYQGYILPKKFNIDKRKAHLSNLIFSGQLTKQEALAELEKPIYPEGKLSVDKAFVLKKLGFSEKEFAEYMHAPEISHSYYGDEDGAYINNYLAARHFLGRIKRKIFSYYVNAGVEGI